MASSMMGAIAETFRSAYRVLDRLCDGRYSRLSFVYGEDFEYADFIPQFRGELFDVAAAACQRWQQQYASHGGGNNIWTNPFVYQTTLQSRPPRFCGDNNSARLVATGPLIKGLFCIFWLATRINFRNGKRFPCVH